MVAVWSEAGARREDDNPSVSFADSSLYWGEPSSPETALNTGESSSPTSLNTRELLLPDGGIGFPFFDRCFMIE